MSTPSSQLDVADFRSLMARILHPKRIAALALKHRGSNAGTPEKISAFWLVVALVFHVFQTCGVLSAHLKRLTGKQLSDSALSERRQRLGVPFFEALLEAVLCGLAHPHTHPGAFYKGLRLVGVDGTQWSVSNTPPIKAKAKKSRTRRKRAAFYKLSMCALYELGTHNPLAARVGLKGESEMELARPLLSFLCGACLLIADRCYGGAKFVLALIESPNPPWFLLRVRKNLKAKVLRRLRDGSSLVNIRDNTSGKSFCLREIHARVRRRSGQWVSLRLWTNLLDEKNYPAMELIGLYGVRWEQEIAYKQLKIHLRRSPLLLSHTLVTAAQEVLCLVLAQAVVARGRLAAAGNHTPLMQISFVRTLDALRSLWASALLWEKRLSARQTARLLRRVLRQLAVEASPPRRPRSCPRALRQPVAKWPRLLRNSVTTGAFRFKILRAAA